MDDVTLLLGKGHNLLRGIYLLSRLYEEYHLKISDKKTKTMAFSEKDPVRSRIVNKITEQVNHFNSLGCDNAYNYDKVESKVGKYGHICDYINRYLRNKTRQTQELNFIKL